MKMIDLMSFCRIYFTKYVICLLVKFGELEFLRNNYFIFDFVLFLKSASIFVFEICVFCKIHQSLPEMEDDIKSILWTHLYHISVFSPHEKVPFCFLVIFLVTWDLNEATKCRSTNKIIWVHDKLFHTFLSLLCV